MEYYGVGGGKLIHENQKQKISWHCPFKVIDTTFNPSLFSLVNSFKGTQDWEFFFTPILEFALFLC